VAAETTWERRATIHHQHQADGTERQNNRRPAQLKGLMVVCAAERHAHFLGGAAPNAEGKLSRSRNVSMISKSGEWGIRSDELLAPLVREITRPRHGWGTGGLGYRNPDG
jgi:hypothetical protein